MYDHKSIYSHAKLPSSFPTPGYIVWLYKLWTTVVPGLKPQARALQPGVEIQKPWMQPMNPCGPGLHDVHHLPNLSAKTLLQERTQVLPTFTLWRALINSSILHPVTPAITTPTAYFRKHRIVEYLSQTRCSGQKWDQIWLSVKFHPTRGAK